MFLDLLLWSLPSAVHGILLCAWPSQICPFYEDSSNTGLGPTRRTLFQFNQLCLQWSYFQNKVAFWQTVSRSSTCVFEGYTILLPVFNTSYSQKKKWSPHCKCRLFVIQVMLFTWWKKDSFPQQKPVQYVKEAWSFWHVKLSATWILQKKLHS
jgi:hypothetical protein